ncbi:hypothetical protein BASA61_001843, partial [Batrachochytrium salamandrivorans]
MKMLLAYGFCGTTPEYCGVIASQSWVHVIPIRCWTSANVKSGRCGRGTSLDVGQTNVARQLASVELRKSIVALDVSRHL